MISERKFATFLLKYIFNPTIVFFVYFLLVSSFGLSRNETFIFFAVVFPFLLIAFLFLYLPLLAFLFRSPTLEKSIKINHVLEHGTIFFLKEKYAIKRGVGGSAEKDGFRIYGKIKSKEDIHKAFEKLSQYLNGDKESAVVSKYCGSNIPILDGISFILLTISFFVFLAFDLDLTVVKIILAANIILFFLLRYPVGKYFQRKCTMCFEFSEPQIISIKKVRKKEILEKSPIYFVETKYKA